MNKVLILLLIGLSLPVASFAQELAEKPLVEIADKYSRSSKTQLTIDEEGEFDLVSSNLAVIVNHAELYADRVTSLSFERADKRGLQLCLVIIIDDVKKDRVNRLAASRAARRFNIPLDFWPPDKKDKVSKPVLAKLKAVNINVANLDELMSLPGIGEKKAQAIIDYRKNNQFRLLADLLKVDGIKEGTFNKVKKHVSVR